MTIVFLLASLMVSDLAPAENCSEPAPATDAIIICGERAPVERYRIDPAVLEQQRTANANPLPRQTSVVVEKCPPHGLQCEGQGLIPVSGIALAALRLAILAAQGEDLKKPLGIADSYAEYREAKAKEQRRRKDRQVRLDFGAAPRR